MTVKWNKRVRKSLTAELRPMEERTRGRVAELGEVVGRRRTMKKSKIGRRKIGHYADLEDCDLWDWKKLEAERKTTDRKRRVYEVV